MQKIPVTKEQAENFNASIVKASLQIAESFWTNINGFLNSDIAKGLDGKVLDTFPMHVLSHLTSTCTFVMAESFLAVRLGREATQIDLQNQKTRDLFFTIANDLSKTMMSVYDIYFNNIKRATRDMHTRAH